ncbi:hypothetical protein F4818DRAFT_452060 [Hypoxylon cercidicola]|nr:hypothetical protein F4818DRAFT_452060 [Hypoxylon cercidicola]
MDQIGIESPYTLEIGNEPTFYPWFSKINNTAGVETYAKRYPNLQDQLKQRIPSLDGNWIFQALDTAANNAKDLMAKPAFETGLNEVATSIRQVGFHYYYQSHPGPHTFDDKNHPATDFAFTETGYNVGGGRGDLGNNLATVLWAVDFQLYCMTVNVSRINWQQILRGSLHMWRAVETQGLPAAVAPDYYSQPFVVDFIGKGGQTQVAPLDGDGDGDGTLVAYAAYESGKLARIALLNLNLWTPTAQPHTLKGLPSAAKQARVHHLTALSPWWKKRYFMVHLSLFGFLFTEFP